MIYYSVLDDDDDAESGGHILPTARLEQFLRYYQIIGISIHSLLMTSCAVGWPPIFEPMRPPKCCFSTLRRSGLEDMAIEGKHKAAKA